MPSRHPAISVCYLGSVNGGGHPTEVNQRRSAVATHAHPASVRLHPASIRQLPAPVPPLPPSVRFCPPAGPCPYLSDCVRLAVLFHSVSPGVTRRAPPSWGRLTRRPAAGRPVCLSDGRLPGIRQLAVRFVKAGRLCRSDGRRWRAVAPSCGSEVRRPPVQISEPIRAAGAAPMAGLSLIVPMIMLCAAECLGDRVSKVTLRSPTCDSVCRYY